MYGDRPYRTYRRRTFFGCSPLHLRDGIGPPRGRYAAFRIPKSAIARGAADR